MYSGFGDDVTSIFGSAVSGGWFCEHEESSRLRTKGQKN